MNVNFPVHPFNHLVFAADLNVAIFDINVISTIRTWRTPTHS